MEIRNKDLTTYTIHQNTKIIAGEAFRNCVDLTEIVIPNSVTKIGEGAFRWCKRLRKIIIPNSVATISKNAFDKCELLNIYCRVNAKPDGWDNDWNYYDCP